MLSIFSNIFAENEIWIIKKVVILFLEQMDTSVEMNYIHSPFEL